MSEEFPKHFDFAGIEASTSQRWLDAGAFAATPDDREETYVIMMPLPNVTGALHMGHAMDNVMQDFLIRWHRMRGENTLWQPGTDHAGIATQAVVEKRLFELEGKTRHDIGREALVQRIWDWKDQYQARIVAQQQRMGCSADWNRQRFTMDEVCTAAVRETFFRLFRDGLIYRGNRLVNWDCHLQTAVSDDEIVTVDVQGHFWYIRYPVIEPQPGEPTHVVVATTRPETMLGDTAVACHPDPAGELTRQIERARERVGDAGAKERPELEAELERLEERERSVLPHLVALRDMALAGRQVMLPLQERPIPLILDDWAKPGLGTGCVKITPGHDPNDYEVWTRHTDEIDIVNILNADGTLNANAGAYADQERFDARDHVVADLQAAGLIERIEDRAIPIGHSDRSKTPIEPYLSQQWFVRMDDVEGGLLMGRGTEYEFRTPGLAQAAMDAVDGSWTTATGKRLEFHPDPERYAATYLSWLKEKRDWCISRQLWWGHRIPIWSADADAAVVGELIDALDGNGDAELRIATPDDRILTAAEARDLEGEGPFGIQLCPRGEDAEQALAAVIERFGLAREEDVLDTWFSSALWPFSTLGWPDPATARILAGQSPLVGEGARPSTLETYYPGSCLVTARDIITLWVARMLVAGLYNLGDVPFTDCFIHANIQDGKGERMSKSKGNGIDPVDIIDRYGADALRYVLCEMQSGTQDIRLPVQAISPFSPEGTEELIDLATAEHGRSVFTFLDPRTGGEFDVLGTIESLPKARLTSDRFDVGRAFCTKLWNAARFAFLSVGEHRWEPVAWDELLDEDRWILSRLSRTLGATDAQMRAYNPSAAIGVARDFFWSDFCDWYVEMVKPRLFDESRAPVARTVVSLVLDQIIRLFHPFVPFITEALWERLNALVPVRGLAEPLPGSRMVIHALWPEPRAGWEDDAIEADFTLLRDVIRGIRNIRAKYNIPPRRKLPVAIKAPADLQPVLRRLEPHIVSQAFASAVEVGDAPERGATTATDVIGDLEVYVEGVFDPAEERARLLKERAKLEKQVSKSARKLDNPGFVAKAPPAVVDKERARLADEQGQLAAIDAMLADLPTD